jgi:quercetin dioxygenase-like cupin family protein
LHITHGQGLIGLRDENPQLMHIGDTIWIPPNEEHWHGATAENGMTHIAIQEALNGEVAKWLELVNDKEYQVK